MTGAAKAGALYHSEPAQKRVLAATFLFSEPRPFLCGDKIGYLGPTQISVSSVQGDSITKCNIDVLHTVVLDCHVDTNIIEVRVWRTPRSDICWIGQNGA